MLSPQLLLTPEPDSRAQNQAGSLTTLAMGGGAAVSWQRESGLESCLDLGCKGLTLPALKAQVSSKVRSSFLICLDRSLVECHAAQCPQGPKPFFF